MISSLRKTHTLCIRRSQPRKTHLKKTVTYSVAFTPDGQNLVIGGEKNNAAHLVPIKK